MTELTPQSTIRESVDAYLESIAHTHAEYTIQAYSGNLGRFVAFLDQNGIDTDSVTVAQISVSWIESFFKSRGHTAPSTRQTYMYAILGWCKLLEAAGLVKVDLKQLRELVRFSATSVAQSAPPDYYTLSRVVEYALSLADVEAVTPRERLISLRDRALIVTLADTGLELREICSLRQGNVDWKHNRLVLDDKTVVNLSPRASGALLEYVRARSSDESVSSRSSQSTPLFVSYRGRGKYPNVALKPVSVRYVLARRVQEALGVENDGTITPVSFRNYFAAAVLQSFVSLHPKVVHRCKALFESGHYDDAIFNAMKLVEEEIRSAISGGPTDLGKDLITKAMHPKSPLITFSSVAAEQEAAFFLYRGALGLFKNPLSHRTLEVSNPVKTLECLTLASLLLRMLDEST